MARQRKRLDISNRALRDIAGILKTSFREFGEAASIRYRTLLEQALDDIDEDPERIGSKEQPEIMVAGARVYHIEFSRAHVRGERVKEPRHFLLYRIQQNGMIGVGRVLHDSRDVALHLPKGYGVKRQTQ